MKLVATERIYLQVDLDNFGDDVTWCSDMTNDSDVEYIRADVVAARLQSQTDALDRADSLTAAEYDDLIYLCRQAEQINNTPSVRQRYHRLAEKVIERQRLLEATGSAADASGAILDRP